MLKFAKKTLLKVILLSILFSSCNDDRYSTMPSLRKQQEESQTSDAYSNIRISGRARLPTTRFLPLVENKIENFKFIDWTTQAGRKLPIHGTIYGFRGKNSNSPLIVAIDFVTYGIINTTGTGLRILDDNVKLERLRYQDNLGNYNDITDFSLLGSVGNISFTNFRNLDWNLYIYYNDALEDDNINVDFNGFNFAAGSSKINKLIYANAVGDNIMSTRKIGNVWSYNSNVSKGIKLFNKDYFDNHNTSNTVPTFNIPMESRELVGANVDIVSDKALRIEFNNSGIQLVPDNCLVCYKITNTTNKTVTVKDLKIIPSATFASTSNMDKIPLYSNVSFSDYSTYLGKLSKGTKNDNDVELRSIGLILSEVPYEHSGVSNKMPTKEFVVKSYKQLIRSWYNIAPIDNTINTDLVRSKITGSISPSTTVGMDILSPNIIYKFADNQEISPNETKIFFVKASVNYNVSKNYSNNNKAPDWINNAIYNGNKIIDNHPYIMNADAANLYITLSNGHEDITSEVLNIEAKYNGANWFETGKSVSVPLKVRCKNISTNGYTDPKNPLFYVATNNVNKDGTGWSHSIDDDGIFNFDQANAIFNSGHSTFHCYHLPTLNEWHSIMPKALNTQGFVQFFIVNKASKFASEETDVSIGGRLISSESFKSQFISFNVNRDLKVCFAIRFKSEDKSLKGYLSAWKYIYTKTSSGRYVLKIQSKTGIPENTDILDLLDSKYFDNVTPISFIASGYIRDNEFFSTDYGYYWSSTKNFHNTAYNMNFTRLSATSGTSNPIWVGMNVRPFLNVD